MHWPSSWADRAAQTAEGRRASDSGQPGWDRPPRCLRVRANPQLMQLRVAPAGLRRAQCDSQKTAWGLGDSPRGTGSCAVAVQPGRAPAAPGQIFCPVARHMFSLATYREVGFLAQQLRSLWLGGWATISPWHSQRQETRRKSGDVRPLWSWRVKARAGYTDLPKVKSTFPVLTSHLLQCVSTVLKEVCLGRF